MKNLIMALPLIFTPLLGFANQQSAPTPNLYELSIEDLLKVNVSAGTNIDKVYAESPASIYLYTKPMMDDLKTYTIKDLAEVTPGYSSYLGFGERTLVSRGQKASGFDNNHHLILIDGIKVNHSRNGRALIEEELSLFGAAQVEFLNGPASALYGTGAFAGVINIVSEQAKSNESLSKQRVGLGTHNSIRVFNNYSKNNSTGLFNLQFSYQNKDSENLYAGEDESGWKSQNDLKSSYLNASYKLNSTAAKGFGLGLIVMDRNSGMGPGFFGSSAGYHESNELIWNTTITYLKYDKEISNNQRVETKVTSNRSREKSYFAVSTGDEFRNYDIITQLYSFQSDFISEFSNNHSLLVGVQSESRWREGQPDSYEYIDSPSNFSNEFFQGDSDKLNNNAAYIQYSLKRNVLVPTDFTFGLRSDTVDSPTASFNQVSPRMAVVSSLTSNLKMKLLFSKALKAPNLKNILLNQQAIQENKDASLSYSNIPDDLVAEKIENHEIQFIYFKNDFSLSTSFFKNFRTDSIGSATLDGKWVSVNNTGTTEAHGVEVQFNYKLKEYRGFFNTSWAHSNTPDTNHFTDVPEMSSNLGIIYDPIKSPITYGLVVKNISQFKTSNGEDQPSGFDLVDLNIEYELSKNYSFDLDMKNALDVKQFHPLGGVNADPLPGRSVSLNLNIQ